MKEVPVKLGELIAGKYRVESVLGAGGMGAVVAVTHLELRERRAIKLMLPMALEEPEARQRFMREARAASRLRSEHVARVYDVGNLENGAPYMVMEHLEGQDLRQVAKERGRLPVVEVVGYALQVCEALAEAHANGIVHRDLKPANLFLTTRPDGTACVKVLDFGVSKVLGGTELEMTLTQAVLGSPSYMAPEQMRSARDVDPRADVWALGVILYRLITGQLPFRGENITELVSNVLSTTPIRPSELVPGVPRELDDVVLRCLERDLSRRHASVAVLAAALVPFGAADAIVSSERAARLLGVASVGSRASAADLGADIAPAIEAITVVAGAAAAKAATPRDQVASSDAWVKSSASNGTISVRRWKLLALVATCGLLAIAFGISLASRREPAPATAADAAVTIAAPIARAPVPETNPEAKASPAPIVSVAAPPVEPSSAPAPAPAPTPTLALKPVLARPATPRPTKSAEPEAAPPPPRPAPPSAAPHRVFGSDD